MKQLFVESGNVFIQVLCVLLFLIRSYLIRNCFEEKNVKNKENKFVLVFLEKKNFFLLDIQIGVPL